MTVIAKGYFVTGTDTEVGKTFVAEALVKLWVSQGLKVAVSKPVSAGCKKNSQGLRNSDAEQLLAASNIDSSYEEVNPYAFLPAIAPHIAAQEVGIDINIDRIVDSILSRAKQADIMLVEGAGGLMVPLNANQTLLQLIAKLGYPVILVVAMRLGCLNHALMTAHLLASKDIPISAVIYNGLDESMSNASENIKSLKQRISAEYHIELPRLPVGKAAESEKYLSQLNELA